jgi:hypothetical protein
MVIVGSAADDSLVRNIDYWRSKGLALEFIPYRVYRIGGESYFEFFSTPYDRHSNPAHAKGVIFDTCGTHIEDSIWYMVEGNRVAAFGSQKHVVNYLSKGDTVFLYHKWEGIVAAARVTGKVKEDTAWNACYREVEWLTSPPDKSGYVAMPASEIKAIMGRDFYWAKTIKTPHLSKSDSDTLLVAFRTKVEREQRA